MPNVDDLSETWKKFQDNFKVKVGRALYDSWIDPLSLLSYNDGVVTVAAPNLFMCEWVSVNFGDDIRWVFAKTIPGFRKIVFVVNKSRVNDSSISSEGDKSSSCAINDSSGGLYSKYSYAANGAVSGKKKFQQRNESKNSSFSSGNLDALERIKRFSGSSLDTTCTFDNFVVGSPNQLGYSAAMRVAESNLCSFNPLFIYGGVGLGKTHLMHAISWHLRAKRSDINCLYISAEEFMCEFVRAVRSKDIFVFKEMIRSVDVLMMDDVQFIAGKESTQEEFLHTFKALANQNKQIVISADRAPGELDGIDEKLRSRLSGGLVVDIQPADYSLRLSILEKKVGDLSERAGLDHETLEFLASNIVSNVRMLEGALNRLLAYANLTGNTVNLDVAKKELSDILCVADKKVSVEEIQKRVAKYYGIKCSDMMSSLRTKEISRARQVAMYLSKELTSVSLPEIGKRFDGRDIRNVLYALGNVSKLMKKDPDFCSCVRSIRSELES